MEIEQKMCFLERCFLIIPITVLFVFHFLWAFLPLLGYWDKIIKHLKSLEVLLYFAKCVFLFISSYNWAICYFDNSLRKLYDIMIVASSALGLCIN